MHVGHRTHVEVRIQLVNDLFFLLSCPLSLTSDHLSLGNKFPYLMVYVTTLDFDLQTKFLDHVLEKCWLNTGISYVADEQE